MFRFHVMPPPRYEVATPETPSMDPIPRIPRTTCILACIIATRRVITVSAYIASIAAGKPHAKSHSGEYPSGSTIVCIQHQPRARGTERSGTTTPRPYTHASPCKPPCKPMQAPSSRTKRHWCSATLAAPPDHRNTTLSRGHQVPAPKSPPPWTRNTSTSSIFSPPQKGKVLLHNHGLLLLWKVVPSTLSSRSTSTTISPPQKIQLL